MAHSHVTKKLRKKITGNLARNFVITCSGKAILLSKVPNFNIEDMDTKNSFKRRSKSRRSKYFRKRSFLQSRFREFSKEMSYCNLRNISLREPPQAKIFRKHIQILRCFLFFRMDLYHPGGGQFCWGYNNPLEENFFNVDKIQVFWKWFYHLTPLICFYCFSIYSLEFAEMFWIY